MYELTKENEDFRNQAYDDKTGLTLHSGDTVWGNITVGYGLNVSAGITQAEAQAVLDLRMQQIDVTLASMFAWWALLDDARRAAIFDVCYNIGVSDFLNFHATIDALAKKDYVTASVALLDSEAARELPMRYARNALILRTGVLTGNE